jgi:hypothetical protein
MCDTIRDISCTPHTKATKGRKDWFQVDITLQKADVNPRESDSMHRKLSKRHGFVNMETKENIH